MDILQNDFKIGFVDVFNSGHIRRYERGDIALYTSYAILKAAQAVNFGSQMTSEQIKDCSYDIVEMMPTETFEDITLMFKMFRQGKIGNDQFKPMKAFDSNNICRILIPEYLGLKSEKRMDNYTAKKGEYLSSTDERLKHMSKVVDFDKIDFSEKRQKPPEPLSDQFKTAIDSFTLDQLSTWKETYGNDHRLSLKLAYIKQRIKDLKTD